MVEQARANLQAQEMRLRAQAENALVLLVGEPLPDDLPPGMPLERPERAVGHSGAACRRICSRAVRTSRQAEEKLLAANANIGAARAAFFPRVTLHGRLRHAVADARRPLQAGFGGVVVRAADLGADLRGRREHRQPRSRAHAEDAHRDRQRTKRRSRRRSAKWPTVSPRAARSIEQIKSLERLREFAERGGWICRICGTGTASTVTWRC